MDVKRLLLLIPLAVLAYLLVVQWNQDYGQVTAETQAPTVATSGQPTGQATDEESSGLSVPTTSNGGASQLTGDMTEPAAANANSRALVAVTTDVLDVRIDPQGGDIVYAALLDHKVTNNSDQPFVLLSDNANRSFVAKSGLQLEGHEGRIAFTPSQTDYRLSDGEDSLAVELSGMVNGVEVTKRLTFQRDTYAVKVDYFLDNTRDEPVSARFIGQLARDNSADPSTGSGIGMQSYMGAAYSSPENHYEKVDFEDIQDGSFNNRDVEGGWVAMIQHYFTTAWAPEQTAQNLYYAATDSRGRNVAAFAGPLQTLAPGGAEGAGTPRGRGPAPGTDRGLRLAVVPGQPAVLAARPHP